jgi:hypothetical protein
MISPAFRERKLRLCSWLERHRHCTFAVTEAVPVIANVQVFCLLPPLEQAPDQMARGRSTRSV